MSENSDRRDYSFLMGLMTGVVAGAGLAMWLAPKAAAELRQRVTSSAKDFGDRASEHYEQVSEQIGVRVGAAVDDLTKKRDSMRDDVADAVVRGAKDVAKSIKS
jgi:gas vesicle protein